MFLDPLRVDYNRRCLGASPLARQRTCVDCLCLRMRCQLSYRGAFRAVMIFLRHLRSLWGARVHVELAREEGGMRLLYRVWAVLALLCLLVPASFAGTWDWSKKDPRNLKTAKKAAHSTV